MTAKAKERLTILSDFLQNEVKPRWFHLASWATEGFIERKCGTTACAAGWATVAFPRQGLKLALVGKAHELSYKDNMGFHAAAAFFDIDYLTAIYLFAFSAYLPERRSKSYVIRRIREVVKTGMFSGTPGRFPVQKWTEQDYDDKNSKNQTDHLG